MNFCFYKTHKLVSPLNRSLLILLRKWILHEEGFTPGQGGTMSGEPARVLYKQVIQNK